MGFKVMLLDAEDLWCGTPTRVRDSELAFVLLQFEWGAKSSGKVEGDCLRGRPLLFC